jgi:predicted Rossmann fold flavoprotein
MKVAIIGAGASGCFIAANLPSSPSLNVTIYEKSNKPLQKVLVSGGGRCNVTHACFEVDELLNKYPRGKTLLKKTLHRFGPKQTIEWFENRGIKIKKEDDGRMFPVSDDSHTIIDCLLSEIKKNNANIIYQKGVISISRDEKEFTIVFNDHTETTADKVIIATGGFPKKEQYRWIEKLGHSIEVPVPSLFTFNIPNHPIHNLMGVSVPEVVVKIGGTKIMESGPLLITHWGFSGPAVLKASAKGARELHDVEYQFSIFINWLGKPTEEELKKHISEIRQKNGKQLIGGKNPFELPKRLWEYFLHTLQISSDIQWGNLSASQQNKLIQTLIADRYDIQGKTTFKEEFVTCGGIKLNEINPATMESRLVKGLYFAGEILNVDGITGGFNFQHAWSSGWIIAESIKNE